MCIIDIYSKLIFTTITNAFQTILNNYGRRQNVMWVDQVSEFYNRSVKSWLNDNNIGMYSPHNEEK